MVDELKKSNVEISDVYYCPHHSDNCECRKPKTKLFHDAANKYQIDFSASYAVGDKLRDLAICDEENTKGFFIGNEIINNKNITTIPNLPKILSYIKK